MIDAAHLVTLVIVAGVIAAWVVVGERRRAIRERKFREQISQQWQWPPTNERRP